MKKAFLALVAATAFSASALAQSGDDCSTIKAMIQDLAQNNLKQYTGSEIVPGIFETKAQLDNFYLTQISVDESATEFLAKMNATKDKAAGEKAYKALLAQMKTCLKGYTATDMSNTETLETDFVKPGQEGVTIFVALQAQGDEFAVAIDLKKRK